MTTHQFRQQVRATFPHVTVKVRTVSFADLARDSKQCLTVEGERAIEELIAINALALKAGILPDTNIRFYPVQ